MSDAWDGRPDAEETGAAAARIALDRLDALADVWQAEVNVQAMAAAVASKPDAVERIAALMELAFVEGAYRYHLTTAPEIAAREAAAAMQEREAVLGVISAAEDATEESGDVSAALYDLWRALRARPARAGSDALAAMLAKARREALLEARKQIASIADVTPNSAAAMRVIDEISAERRRQEAKGFDAEHDDGHNNGDLVRAAICYAADGSQKLDCVAWLSPWGDDLFTTGDRRADLVRAAAMLVAEIERLDRAQGGDDASR